MEFFKKDRPLILACSATKRIDSEIEQIMKSGVSLKPTTSMEEFSPYRQCTEAAYKGCLYHSKRYPACLRYNGTFYKQILIKLWEQANRLPVLILSAYYGLLRPTDAILNYNLAISQVKTSCKRLLPTLLESYLDKHNLKKAIFLTSSSYFLPFKGKGIAERLHLYDQSGNEIIGPYARDYYLMAGKILANLLAGKGALTGIEGCFMEVSHA